MKTFLTLNRNVKFQIISSFFTKTMGTATAPFLILYLTNYLSNSILGILVGSSILIIFLSSIIGGYIADNVNRKKFINISQIFQIINMFILTSLIFYIQNSDNEKYINILIIFYILQNISSNIYRPAFKALTMDSTIKENRKIIFRFEYWVTNLSLALGTSIGGFFSSNHLGYLYLISLILMIFLSIGFYKIIENDKQIIKPRLKKNILYDFMNNYKESMKDKKWVIFLLGSSLIFAVEFSLIYYSNIRLTRLFIPLELGNMKVDGVKMFSILQFINTLLVVSCTFIIYKYIKKWSTNKSLLIGISFYVIGYSIISLELNILILILCIIVASIGELIFSPIWQSTQMEFIPPEKRASYAALSGLSNTFAMLIASSFLLISDHFSAVAISSIILISGLLGMSLILWIVSLSKRTQVTLEVENSTSK